MHPEHLIIFFFFSVLTLLACNSEDCHLVNETNLSAINDFNKSDSFVRHIPKDKYGNTDYIYKSVTEGYHKLGLEKIDSACRDFKIRIETNFEKKKNGAEILSITLKNNEWSGMYYTFNQPPGDTGYNNIKADSSEVEPKIGWCQFMNKLFSFGLLTLPNMNDTKVRDIEIADGGYSFFEIGSAKKYRFYYYYSPDILTRTNFKGGDAVVTIFKCINENFSFSSVIIYD